MAHSALLRSCKLRIKIMLKLSARASRRGGSSTEGTSAVGCAKKMDVAYKSLFLHGTIALPTRTHWLPATAATGSQHLGGLRRLSHVRLLAADPVVVDANAHRHLWLLRGDVDKTWPACEHGSVIVDDASKRRSSMCLRHRVAILRLLFDNCVADMYRYSH